MLYNVSRKGEPSQARSIDMCNANAALSDVEHREFAGVFRRQAWYLQHLIRRFRLLGGVASIAGEIISVIPHFWLPRNTVPSSSQRHGFKRTRVPNLWCTCCPDTRCLLHM